MRNESISVVTHELLAQDTTEDMETKRRLLEAMDDRRGDDLCASESTGKQRKSARAREETLLREVTSLHRDFAALEAEHSCLREEVTQLEVRMVESLSEICRLREELRSYAHIGDMPSDWLSERKRLMEELAQARKERSLLTDALTGSESEIARMAVTLDDIARHLSF